MTPLDHGEYFEIAAMRNKAISHVPNDPNNTRFFHWGIEELDRAIGNRFSGMSLILEHENVREHDEQSDNPYLIKSMAFWIIAPVTDPENYTEKKKLLSECYEVALQFYSKIRNDKKKGIYKGYQQGTFNITVFIHIDSTAVGYRCTYFYQEPAPTQLNEDDWREETISE